MFDDKKPLSTFMIGLAAGLFMMMIAIAATAPDQPPGTQVTLHTINLVAGIIAGICLVLALYLALPIIKEDDEGKKEIMCFVVFTLIFVIAFAIVSL
jgi:zinc transporter ZupT